MVRLKTQLFKPRLAVLDLIVPLFNKTKVIEPVHAEANKKPKHAISETKLIVLSLYLITGLFLIPDKIPLSK